MNQSVIRYLLLMSCFFAAVTRLTAQADDYDEAVVPFFRTYCLRCHDTSKQEGKFRLDSLPRAFADQAIAQRWGEVVFRMNSGEMPPKKEPQPKPQELGRVVDWISSRMREGEAARMAKHGPVTHYRLSREEYANTVYDLLGVFYDVNLPGAFNEDPRWHGFERIGSMLSLSPSHVDRYFKAAEIVLDRAFPATIAKSSIQRADAITIRHRPERAQIEAMGIADKVRVMLWPRASMPALRGYWFGQMRESGMYRARIQLSGLPGPDGRTPHLSIWNDKLKRTIFDADIVTTEDKPTVVEFETFLSMPTELEMRNEVPQAFSEIGNHTLNVLNGGGSIFTNSRDSSRLNPTGYKLFDDEGKALFPMLLVDWIEWEGPLTSESDLRKRDGLVPASDGGITAARASLRLLATRAWRRPVTDAEVDRYVKVVEREVAAGEQFPAAYRAAMVGILTSKSFYYLEEGSASQRRDTVNDWELASRLSYFLWGSMPDDELFAAAQTGQLHEADRLKAQLARMLIDPKSKRFTESFPRQWLQLHKVGMFPPDPRLYPDYDMWLEKSMVLETTHYFGEVFARNLPLREFLVSDWTMVNPRLAQFYKLNRRTGLQARSSSTSTSEPTGQETRPTESLPMQSGFQRVALRPEDHRGGLLTQASILMLTSDGTRHRPVHRGVWVSEAIFGRTPPPPPPNVEPLEPTPNNKPKATIRMQLEAHATNSICASCHRNIDPLGFAFDHFDAIGQWRTEEVVPAGQGANPPVNASGQLADGRIFDGSDEFKSLLVQDIDQFAEAFVEQLATFALRRVMTIDDTAAIKAIAQSSKKDGYRLRTVIENFVMSEMFQKR
jgi:hypothetical protein